MRSYLVKNNPDAEIKFIGAGSDSCAFSVHVGNENYVYRFPRYNVVFDQYKQEADLCNFLRGIISAPIPDIEVHDGDVRFAKHKMLMGKKWHWHSLALSPIKQMRLARGIAQFLAELHSANISAFNIESKRVDYVKFDEIHDMISPFLSKHQMAVFKKKFNEIVNKKVPKRDIVICHMGFKGKNSVIDNHGNLVGVFDFGNAGCHERWRDLSIVRKGGNKWLYRQVIRHYEKLTGIHCDRKRIADVGTVEHFIYKRWFFEDGSRRISDARAKELLSKVFVQFYHLPAFCENFLYAMMTLHRALYGTK